MECLNSIKAFDIFSFVGAAAAIIGALIAAGFYTGENGEPYSPLNHFISELGEVGVSRLAWVFNLGLVISGISLIGASISLGLLLPGFLPKIGLGFGILCSIALSLVGFFPMNKKKPHGTAAMIYFRAGLMMMILFNLAIALQPGEEMVLPRLYSLAGLPAIASFAGFLYLSGKAVKQEQSENPLSIDDIERPNIWSLAVVEWSIFVTIVIWFVVIALGL